MMIVQRGKMFFFLLFLREVLGIGTVTNEKWIANYLTGYHLIGLINID
jgi:hypothetical protein